MDEDAWKEAFRNEIMIRGILQLWSLDIEENFQKHQGWLQYIVYSFARFCCQLCGRCWASSKVHILFQIKSQRNTRQVKMHIFKQKCKICTDGYYEHPMFMPENIEIAIGMLVNRISERIYKTPKENLPSKSFISDGRQDGPHDCSNCEGCEHGICTRNSNRNEGFGEIQSPFHVVDWERGINSHIMGWSYFQDTHQDTHEDAHQDTHQNVHQDAHQDVHLDAHQDAHQNDKDSLDSKSSNCCFFWNRNTHRSDQDSLVSNSLSNCCIIL